VSVACRFSIRDLREIKLFFANAPKKSSGAVTVFAGYFRLLGDRS
jgi:hypothetical protein